jgi:RimJ/RimL family protein N-acetyltransferase
VYRAWGPTYPQENLYYPERITHLNECGELVSVVALDAAGAVVGHMALERPDPQPVAESGIVVVSPSHRGRKLMERMRSVVIAEGKRLGLRGIYGRPVTSHTFSQRAIEATGARLCGVQLAAVPQSLEFRAIKDEALRQRESVMLYFTQFQPPPAGIAFAPSQHRETLKAIYGQQGIAPRFGPAEAPAGCGTVHVKASHVTGTGEIRVERVGADTLAEVRRAHQDLCSLAHVEAIYLSLPLGQAGTPAVCTGAEADGYFFCALGPQFAEDGDVLMLQWLARPLDLALLQVASPFGRELVAYVGAERERVGGAEARSA